MASDSRRLRPIRLEPQSESPAPVATNFASLRERLLPPAGILPVTPEKELPSWALAMLPESYRRVMAKLDEAGVLQQIAIAYLERGAGCRLDFAWPTKRVGLRMTSWPVRGGRTIPDFVYTDAYLSERGWVILPIDPEGPAFDDQFQRAVSVMKRLTVYRR